MYHIDNDLNAGDDIPRRMNPTRGREREGRAREAYWHREESKNNGSLGRDGGWCFEENREQGKISAFMNACIHPWMALGMGVATLLLFNLLHHDYLDSRAALHEGNPKPPSKTIKATGRAFVSSTVQTL